MNARSALFDLYGDHLRSRGGRARVAALVLLLSPLGIAAPAVRTAVSRMVKQGWLRPVRIDGASGYALTDRADHRLEEAASRIYRTDGRGRWDGRWHVVVPERSAQRAARERLRNGLAYLGYAPVGDGTWIAARPSPELASLLEAEGLRAERFSARHQGDDAELVRRAWDLDAVGRSYLRWLSDARNLLSSVPEQPSDEQAFAVRSRLVHEWRKFLFTDPGLPRELLPAAWPGDDAASFFDQHAARLQPAAARFVDACLATGGQATAVPTTKGDL
ncbi:PaaX family transcriptional regulator C-terminal domain-containing protein [Jiangella asiatica]|uniref:PaaX family transcriptional regulator n=1 Tax=Jiangella asiatica TaxID=2530372 RepID=A0A4R5DAD6_9ACTN|nr:PaaX family transcriptional regulator C-terminal domain-containing protein [Jiangella asiatica]TDE08741.1 PaaX family transcriptional regulator [Jiangella asiatica]